jgi:hypothetical protein
VFRAIGGTDRGPEKIALVKHGQSRRSVWVKPVAYSGEKKSEDRVLVGKPISKNHSED